MIKVGHRHQIDRARDRTVRVDEALTPALVDRQRSQRAGLHREERLENLLAAHLDGLLAGLAQLCGVLGGQRHRRKAIGRPHGGRQRGRHPRAVVAARRLDHGRLPAAPGIRVAGGLATPLG